MTIDEERQIDGKAAVDTLRKQREAALDAWAQAEGHIAYLMTVIVAQRDVILKKDEEIATLKKQAPEAP